MWIGVILYTMEDTDMHMLRRREQAQRIAAAPDQFKVCEGCESIVSRPAIFCSNCHGYRFNEDERIIVETAEMLANRPQRSVTADDLF